MKSIKMNGLKKAIIRGVIVIVPTYIVAYITDKMVYVVPMLAAMGFIAAGIFEDDTKKRIDTDTADGFKDYKDHDGEGE